MQTMKPQEGDRLVKDHGEEVLITPFSALHNFGPASSRDSVVFTCERPGGDPGPQTQIKTSEAVNKWIQFMTQEDRNIKHVIILMEEKELSAYEEPGLIQAYQDGGMSVHHVPYSSDKAAEKIMTILKDVETKEERVTAHCTHGMGRSGRVAAGWLVKRHGLTVDEAVEEALSTARTHGVERMGAPRQLKEWLRIQDPEL
jgi:protein tyrosine phosphatase (PTP) superfamily phosphohydrolase (DUF442 family)